VSKLEWRRKRHTPKAPRLRTVIEEMGDGKGYRRELLSAVLGREVVEIEFGAFHQVSELI